MLEQLNPGHVQYWIDAYIAKRGIVAAPISERRQAITSGAILVSDARTGDLIVVKGLDFLQFLQTEYPAQLLTKFSVTKVWREAGGRVNIQVTTNRDDGTRGNMKVWAIPLQRTLTS